LQTSDARGRLRRCAAASLLVLAACAGEARPPNLVIVTLDTTRADHLGLYGYFRDTSPALDAFGERAIVFERAIVPMATTLPTHASLFTATHPLEHGVLFNTIFGARPLVPTPRLRTLAQAAGEAGFRTAAFVSAAPLKRGSGIEAGFEHFDQPAGIRRDAEATTHAALAWLSREPPERPFLLWVHYFDAHWPYAPPPPYLTMFGGDAELEAHCAARRLPGCVRPPASGSRHRAAIDLYDGELRYQDDQLAKLLAAIGDRPDAEHTAVVIAGDHGEGLGQHGEAAHGGTWDEQLRAPLLMRIPGEPPRRVPTPITAVDVIPALLGRLEAPALAPLLAQASGRDVLAPGARAVPILSQDTGNAEDPRERRFTLTTERWKLFHIEGRNGASRRLLFDLAADPFELDDVAGAHPELADALASALLSTLEAQRRKGAALRGPEAAAAIDPELAEELRALGYADGVQGP
jgi:arylsulfatase A-like enzyme